MLLARASLLLLAVWGLAGCGGDRVCLSGPCPRQSQSCKDYVDCFVATGGTRGSLDTSYGPRGTCWTVNQAVVDSCSSACASALLMLKMAFPDAGCR